MKTFYAFIFTAFIISFASSCTKDNAVKPTSAQKAVVADKSDLGVGD